MDTNEIIEKVKKIEKEEMQKEKGKIYSLNYDEGGQDKYFNKTEERERNLTIKLLKYLIEENLTVKKLEEMKDFNDLKLKEKLYFKENDIIFFKEKLIEEGSLKKEKLEEISKCFKKNEKYKSVKCEDELVDIYNKMNNKIKKSDYNMVEDFKKAKSLAEKIHWKYLPIYSEIFMKNRGCLPEENLEEFYSDYFAIKYLVEEIKEKGISWKSIEGDINLNKDLKFKVYTNRWDSYDIYSIQRKIYGWECQHISLNGSSLKNGIGSIINNLNHDGVFFPEEGVRNAFKKLWEAADKEEMEVSKLQEKLQEIADWISDVEMNIRRKQPDWCRYY